MKAEGGARLSRIVMDDLGQIMVPPKTTLPQLILVVGISRTILRYKINCCQKYGPYLINTIRIVGESSNVQLVGAIILLILSLIFKFKGTWCL